MLPNLPTTRQWNEYVEAAVKRARKKAIGNRCPQCGSAVRLVYGEACQNRGEHWNYHAHYVAHPWHMASQREASA